MAVTIEQFIQKLTESGVMLGDEITAFQESYTADTAEDFAETLIQNKKLTKYQAQQILQGKSKGLLLGDYLILDTIGAGGMGQVYLAEHRRMGRQVALKTLPESVAKDLQKVKRFQREVRAAAKLSHPNVVTAYDAGEDKGVHYFVMECVDGIDLSQLVKQQGTLPVAQAVNYVLQAAKGLKYAHSKGIVHRDIKPANMLLDSEGTVKLLDMGLARINSLDEEVAEIDLTSTGMVMGTVDYMAPEQAVDTKQADARSDIYSLGCMLHYLLTGKSVYGGDTMVKKIFAHRDQPIPSLSATHSGIPSALDVLFQKMVAKDPNDRQQSMSEVISELESCGVLEPPHVSASSNAVSNAPAFDRSLKDQVNAATLTIGQPSTRQALTTDEKSTLPSIVLDETIAITGTPSRSKRHKISSPRQLWPIVAGCLLGTVGLIGAAGFFLKVDTAAGTVIIEIDQPELAGAVVSVDGQKKVTIKTGEGKEPIEIVADEKTHTLKVTKGGFETFTKQFTVKAGGNQTIKVRLEPLAAAKSIPKESSSPQSEIEGGSNFALIFDGKDDYVEIPTLKLDYSQPITLEAYVSPFSDKQQVSQDYVDNVSPLFADNAFLGEESKDAFNLIFDNKNKGYWFGYQPPCRSLYFRGQEDLYERQHHIVALCTGNELQLYLNGKQHAQGGSPLNPQSVGTPPELSPSIGRDYYLDNKVFRFFFGQIDELRISNTARYEGDFTPATRLEADKNTLALYHFDEGEGDKLIDVSGNGHHGTIHGATWQAVAATPLHLEYQEREEEVARWVLSVGGWISNKQTKIDKQVDLTSPVCVWSTMLYGNQKIADEDLKQLTELEYLFVLALADTNISDAGMTHVSKIRTLATLDLQNSKVTGRGLRLLENHPSLTTLWANGLSVSNDDLAFLCTLRNLEELSLSDPGITDDAVIHLAKMTSLRKLNVRGSLLSFAAITELKKALPECNISHSANVPESSATSK